MEPARPQTAGPFFICTVYAAGELLRISPFAVCEHALARLQLHADRSRHAETAEEARALLAAGQGHRCHVGDCLNVELDSLNE